MFHTLLLFSLIFSPAIAANPTLVSTGSCPAGFDCDAYDINIVSFSGARTTMTWNVRDQGDNVVGKASFGEHLTPSNMLPVQKFSWFREFYWSPSGTEGVCVTVGVDTEGGASTGLDWGGSGANSGFFGIDERSFGPRPYGVWAFLPPFPTCSFHINYGKDPNFNLACLSYMGDSPGTLYWTNDNVVTNHGNGKHTYFTGGGNGALIAGCMSESITFNNNNPYIKDINFGPPICSHSITNSGQLTVLAQGTVRYQVTTTATTMANNIVSAVCTVDIVAAGSTTTNVVTDGLCPLASNTSYNIFLSMLHPCTSTYFGTTPYSYLSGPAFTYMGVGLCSYPALGPNNLEPSTSSPACASAGGFLAPSTSCGVRCASSFVNFGAPNPIYNCSASGGAVVAPVTDCRAKMIVTVTAFTTTVAAFDRHSLQFTTTNAQGVSTFFAVVLLASDPPPASPTVVQTATTCAATVPASPTSFSYTGCTLQPKTNYVIYTAVDTNGDNDPNESPLLPLGSFAFTTVNQCTIPTIPSPYTGGVASPCTSGGLLLEGETCNIQCDSTAFATAGSGSVQCTKAGLQLLGSALTCTPISQVTSFSITAQSTGGVSFTYTLSNADTTTVLRYVVSTSTSMTYAAINAGGLCFGSKTGAPTAITRSCTLVAGTTYRLWAYADTLGNGAGLSTIVSVSFTVAVTSCPYTLPSTLTGKTASPLSACVASGSGTLTTGASCNVGCAAGHGTQTAGNTVYSCSMGVMTSSPTIVCAPIVTYTITNPSFASGKVLVGSAGTCTSASCAISVVTGVGYAVTASPVSGSVFVRWSGATSDLAICSTATCGRCDGTPCGALTCNVGSAASASAVTAAFQPCRTMAITLSVGGGSLSSHSVSVSDGYTPTQTCASSSCPSLSVLNTATVSLAATTPSGYRFKQWTVTSGSNFPGCNGKSTTPCSSNAISGNNAIIAEFIRQRSLTVTVSGTGSIQVTDTVNGSVIISVCTSTCSTTLDHNQQVTLSASTSAPAVVFQSWSGACSGTSICALTVTATTTATAIFAYTLTVGVVPTGLAGSVTVGTSVCSTSSCPYTYASGTAVNAVAATANPAVLQFRAWSSTPSGLCGSSPSCSLIISNVVSLTANFDRFYTLDISTAGDVSDPTLNSVSVTDTGSGVVLGTCPTICSYSIKEGTVVRLTHASSPDYDPTWGGDAAGCAATAKTCDVTVNAATAVSAEWAGASPHSLAITIVGQGVLDFSSTQLTCTSGGKCTTTQSYSTTVTTTVTFVVTAPPGSRFIRFSGDCTGASCSLILPAGTPQTWAVTATFVDVVTLSVVKAGTGDAQVDVGTLSLPYGMATGKIDVDSGTSLTASWTLDSSNPDNQLVGFSNACTGTTSPCTFSITSAATLVVSTERLYHLSVSKPVDPGSVTSSDGTFTCAAAKATCTVTRVTGSTLTLSATPSSPTAQFVGWSSACTGTSTCVVLFDADKSVDVTFEETRTITVSTTAIIAQVRLTILLSDGTTRQVLCSTNTCSVVDLVSSAVTATVIEMQPSKYRVRGLLVTSGTGSCPAGLTCSITTSIDAVSVNFVALFKIGFAWVQPLGIPGNITFGAASGAPICSLPHLDCSRDVDANTALAITVTPSRPDLFAFVSFRDAVGSAMPCKGSTTPTCSFVITADSVLLVEFTVARLALAVPTSVSTSSFLGGYAFTFLTKRSDTHPLPPRLPRSMHQITPPALMYYYVSDNSVTSINDTVLNSGIGTVGDVSCSGQVTSSPFSASGCALVEGATYKLWGGTNFLGSGPVQLRADPPYVLFTVPIIVFQLTVNILTLPLGGVRVEYNSGAFSSVCAMSSCSYTIPRDLKVTLTPEAASSSIIDWTWGGAGTSCTANLACNVLLSSDLTVTITFMLPTPAATVPVSPSPGSSITTSPSVVASVSTSPSVASTTSPRPSAGSSNGPSPSPSLSAQASPTSLPSATRTASLSSSVDRSPSITPSETPFPSLSLPHIPSGSAEPTPTPAVSVSSNPSATADPSPTTTRLVSSPPSSSPSRSASTINDEPPPEVLPSAAPPHPPGNSTCVCPQPEDPCLMAECVNSNCLVFPRLCEDDGNPCTIESCRPGRGCQSTLVQCPASTECVVSECSQATGGCVTFNTCLGENACTGVVCDKVDDCTEGICAPLLGGKCVYSPRVCVDFNPCTRDTCVLGSGCVFEPIESCDVVCESLVDCDRCLQSSKCEPFYCNATLLDTGESVPIRGENVTFVCVEKGAVPDLASGQANVQIQCAANTDCVRPTAPAPPSVNNVGTPAIGFGAATLAAAVLGAIVVATSSYMVVVKVTQIVDRGKLDLHENIDWNQPFEFSEVSMIYESAFEPNLAFQDTSIMV